MASHSIIAPAKVNLFLHITGKRDDGYHLLQSLVAFADIGDEIKVEEADSFSLSMNNQDIPVDENNLVTQAVEKTANALNREPNIKVTLYKEIPAGAGLGGGSSDAAATIKALQTLWDEQLGEEELASILIGLGADVPVCYEASGCFVKDIGETITLLPSFPPMPAVLVHPNVFCATEKVFENFSASFSSPVTIPEDFDSIDFLKEQRNDLTDAAQMIAPEIKDVLAIIEKQDGCKLSRMTGSGSACFGLFKTRSDAENAADTIQKEKPDWWVRPVLLK